MNENDVSSDHTEHPPELLAAYVGGEGSEQDRAAVETLLASCSDCRSEVELAVQARAALQGLPELEAPGLTDERILSSVTSLQRPATTKRGVLSRIRDWGWERVAWGAGIVAAGSLVALFFFVQLGQAPLEQQAAEPRPAGGSQFGLSRGGRDYTPASLDALARRLVRSERTALARPQPAPARTDEATQEDLARDRPASCLRRGGGLLREARPVHLERAAFRGRPAFIGAFQSGDPAGARYLLVLAVDRNTCDPLYVINRSL